MILCGPNRSGAFGLATARHLSSQGVRTHVYLPDLPHYPEPLAKELHLYKLTGQRWTTNAKQLPGKPNVDSTPGKSVDLIICGLEDHEMWDQERSQPWLRNARSWANNTRANSVLYLDPPSDPAEPLINSCSGKVVVLPGLPLWHPGAEDKVYVVNTAVPDKIYQEVGIKYRSPFGAKTVIPLHRVS